jgi:hypothetical protein
LGFDWPELGVHNVTIYIHPAIPRLPGCQSIMEYANCLFNIEKLLHEKLTDIKHVTIVNPKQLLDNFY